VGADSDWGTTPWSFLRTSPGWGHCAYVARGQTPLAGSMFSVVGKTSVAEATAASDSGVLTVETVRVNRALQIQRHHVPHTTGWLR